MNKVITYWLYYLIETGEIYAYTDNKKYAEIFEKDRNMKIFHKVKKEMKKEEISFLAREYQSDILKEVNFPIYDKNTNEWIDGSFIMSGMEFITVTTEESRLLSAGLQINCDIDPYIFKKSIRQALHILGYNSLFSGEYQPGQGEIDIGISESLKPDVLGIFIRYFGKTMKK